MKISVRRILFPAPEVWPLRTLLLIAGILFVFVAVADAVGEGETVSLDRKIILAFRVASDISNPVGPLWLEEAVRDVTSLGSIVVVGLFSVLFGIYLLLQKRRGEALVLLVSVAGGLALNDALKFVFDRPRPDFLPHTAGVFTTSFPSGHAALSSVAYLTIAALLARNAQSESLRLYLMMAAVLLTVLIGISRIYLGLHYPSDVLAGWCIGSAWVLICWMGVGRRPPAAPK